MSAAEGTQGGGGLFRKVAVATAALTTAGLAFYSYRQIKKEMEDSELRHSFVEEQHKQDVDW